MHHSFKDDFEAGALSKLQIQAALVIRIFDYPRTREQGKNRNNEGKTHY
jgi:hypothetical protein